MTKEDFDAVSAVGTPGNRMGRVDAVRAIYIATVALFAGMAIMIIELTGTRLLAPWFGNSLYTWTSLIGVVMISISLGYYLGGMLADRIPKLTVLAHLLAASACLTCGVPLIYPGLEDGFSSLGVIRGPVTVSAILFALPGCCVAAVAPFSVRLMSLVTGDEKIGFSSGSVGMFGTLGSVIGTFATGFVLVPHLELRLIFLLTGAVLGLLALVGYALQMPRSRGGVILAAGLVVLWALLSAGIEFLQPTAVVGLLYEEQSFYHRIRVMEETEGQRPKHALYLDSTVEGAQFVEREEIPLRYQRYWQLAEVFCPELEAAAFLGGGAFAMPEALARRFPTAQVEVAEFDPAVIAVGHRYFHLGEYPNINALPQDARRFLRMSEARYDFIFGDAYNGVRSIPAHLVTTEFFRTVQSRLALEGVYVMNLLSGITGKHAGVFEAIHRTLSEVFPHVYVFKATRSMLSSRLTGGPSGLEQVQNVVLVATNSPVDIADATDRFSDSAEILALLESHLADEYFDTTNAPLLTDGANPIEFLVTRSLD